MKEITAADQLAILAVITKADALATRRDVVSYVELFTPEGKIIGAKGSAKGKQELTSFTKAMWQKEPETTFHLTIAPLIVGQTEAAVQTQSTLLLVDGATNKIINTRQIKQTIVFTNKWLISSREVK